LLTIDGDDRARGSNGIGQQHRHIARPAADVEDAHSRRNSAIPDQSTGDGADDIGLQLKAFEFRVGVTERIGRSSHRSFP
jgi:hypothetical protein